MTTVQTICNAVLPSTPANWLYEESDCDGLSSDLQYTHTSHLNHRCQRYKVSIMLRMSLVRWESKRNNYWEDELHLRDECGTKHNRHSFAIPRDWTLNQTVMVFVQTYGTSRSHLNHRCQHHKVSIMLKKSRSPRSSMEGFCPWKVILSISWIEQLKSLCIVKLIMKRCLSVLIDI